MGQKDKQTDKQTDGQGDSMTKWAQWGLSPSKKKVYFPIL